MNQIVPCLWFADNNCEEAVTYYVSIFPNAEIHAMVRYPNEAISEHFEGMTGKILNAEFSLNGQRYVALDGGPTFRFNEAISLMIECDDQDEIDYYWDKLSHVEEAEQCGWVRDRFGLSWQIIPKNIAELGSSDAQIEALMGMKKIIIKDLEAAR